MNRAMVWTEFYKIINKKYIWIFIILFSAFFAFSVFQFKDNANAQYSLQPIRNEIQQAVADEGLGSIIRSTDYTSSYEDIKPFLAASAVEYIEQYRTVYYHETSVASFLENKVVDKICNYYERVDDRQNEILSLQSSLAELQESGKDGSFLYSVQSKLLSIYEKTSGIELNLESWDKIIDLNYAWFIPGCTMLIIILGLAGIYSDEYTNKTQSILLTTKKGRKGVFLSKLTAGTIFSILCVLYFQLFSVLVTGIVYGFPSINITLVSIYGFKLTPVTWLALGFYIIQLLGSLLAAFVMSSLTMCLSVYCKNALLPFFIAGAYYGGTFIWAKMIMLPQYVTTLLSSLAELSPFMLQSTTDLVSSGRYINFFGCAIPTFYANIIFNLLIAFVSLLFCYRGYVRKQVKG
jgi:ABC-type transport system involved in multi-copper enzyme maturation permease subunit